MDLNQFEYLTINRLGYIHNYIQSVVPFVYDQSLSLYDLLKKLVDYANEIGKRNNDLASTFDNLVDYVNECEQKQVEFINKFVAQMRAEFEAWKTLYNKKYEEFTAEQIKNYNEFVAKTEKALTDFQNNINRLFEEFKTDINKQEADFETRITQRQTDYETNTNNQIKSWKNEIDELLKDIQTTVDTISKQYNARFTSFEQETNESLNEYYSDLIALINKKSGEINTRITNAILDIEKAISDKNLEPLVKEEVLTLVESGKVAEALENLYGSIIRITYWDTNTPLIVESDTPVYHYNPETYTLTDCVTGNKVPLLRNSIYMYKGYVYTSEINKTVEYQVLDVLGKEYYYDYGKGVTIPNTRYILIGQTSNVKYSYSLYDMETQKLIVKFGKATVTSGDNVSLSNVKPISLSGNTLRCLASKYNEYYKYSLYDIDMTTGNYTQVNNTVVDTNSLNPVLAEKLYVKGNSQIDVYNIEDLTLNKSISTGNIILNPKVVCGKYLYCERQNYQYEMYCVDLENDTYTKLDNRCQTLMYRSGLKIDNDYIIMSNPDNNKTLYRYKGSELVNTFNIEINVTSLTTCGWNNNVFLVSFNTGEAYNFNGEKIYENTALRASYYCYDKVTNKFYSTDYINFTYTMETLSINDIEQLNEISYQRVGDN